MSELAADGIPVAVTCRILKIARQPYCRWLACQVTDGELAEAYRANALCDAHRADPEFGYRYLADEADAAGEAMCRRTAWRICSTNGWASTITRRGKGRHRRSGPPVHDDLVKRDFTADTDAHQIGGEIGARWAATGWESGPLGYPTTDELTNPDGVGKRNWFQREGAIYWHPPSGAWAVWGDILKNWASRGYETGRFGYPTSGEFDFSGGKAQNFNHKTIDWRPGDPIAPADYVNKWNGTRRESRYADDTPPLATRKDATAQAEEGYPFSDPDGTTLPPEATTTSCGV